MDSYTIAAIAGNDIACIRLLEGCTGSILQRDTIPTIRRNADIRGTKDGGALNANAGSRVVLDDVGQFRVGSKANFIAFDGTNIWITNTGDNNVTKLRACDGGFLGNFPTGVGPLGTAFDGVNVWVSNALDGTISQM